MRLFLITLIFLPFLSTSILAQHQEKAPKTTLNELPQWAQIMYSENPNPEEVQAVYDTYYETNEFIKNGHTQYYKHWLRNLSRDINGVFSGSTSFKIANQEEVEYAERSAIARSLHGPTSTWECVGPYDYDQEAAERSYAPGAAHVYTVEKAPSNSNVLYIGTATAGVFKSIDNGLNWTLVTRDYILNSIRAIEIDPNNENIVFFESGGSVYKTTNGGTSWALTGDAIFQASSHSANDIVAYPGSSLIYFLCADDGLYHTTDAGANWTRLKSGEYQELEFKPDDPTQVYCIFQADNYTRFYKSTDGGLTWIMKPIGWPGIASTSNTAFSGIDMGGAVSDYINFAVDPEPGNSAMQDFSIELKVKSSGWFSDPALFSNKNWNNGNNRGFVIAGNTNGSTWKFNIGDGSSRIDINGGTINDDTWHHLVVTYDYDGTKSVYQDGQLINSSTSNISDDVINLSNHLALCQDGTYSYSAGFGIEISDVRIWSTVLDAATIQSWSCQTLNNTHPNYADLENQWKCDEGSGTTVADVIGGNNGTINGNSSWTASNNMICIIPGLTSSEHQRRVEIAVTADEPDYIYALATGAVNGGTGLFGVYKSTDGGESWTFNCCGPQPGGPAVAGSNINMMGWQDNGSDDGGQYYYDLGLNVSPTDADKVHVGGVNHWVSTDGGVSFTCPSKWSHPHKAEYVHADIHDIRYFGSELWIACDGGLFYSTDEGDNISRRMVGVAGTDFWGFGGGFSDGEVLLGGTYHNGTLLKDNNVYVNDWLSTRGGDNYRGFVNSIDNSIVYDDGGRRELSGNRTQNFGEYSYSMKPNATYVIGESSSIEFDPRNPNISYTGTGTAIWKTEDNGQNFTQIYDFGSGNSLGEIRVADADPNTIYAATFGGSDKVWRSTNGGSSFIDITPSSNSVPYSITIDAENAQIIWAVRTISWTWQGTLNGNKVFKSTNGGISWSTVSHSALDGEYLTNVLHQKGTAGGIYVGTRRAVYYKNDAMADFALFNNQLPLSTTSTRLVANYGAGKLYNGTNRSVYKVDFYENSSPVAQIAAEDFNVNCTGESIQFYSNSVALNSATYNWSFPGGTPSSSSEKNPIVSFGSQGIFSISLTVTDANGSDSQTLSNFITIDNDCSPETFPGMALSLAGGGSDYGSIDAPDFSTNNFTISAWIKRDGNQADWSGLVFSRPTSGGSGLNIQTNNRLGYHWDGSASYNWNSGLVIPDGGWVHVALVITPSSATIYMNGVPSANNISHSSHTFNSTIYLGADPNSSSRRFKGLMDEVCIFNRALSATEIRELRHLTQTTGDPNFKHYYQFNEASGDVFNRAGGGFHCNLQGTASRTTSTIPVAGGNVSTLDCSSGGIKDFGDADLSLEFPASGTYPNGDLVAFKLNLAPDQIPNAFPTSSSYWLINNYGTNSSFSELENIVFENIGNIPNGNTASQYKLYKRDSNAEGNTWGTSIDYADAIATGANGNITFSQNNGITSFSQFIITTENTVLPIDLLHFSVHLNKENTVDLRWATASEVDNNYFIIEKSQNGMTFDFLEKINSFGNSQSLKEYATIDENPFNGTSFYRLKQVDIDGNFTYSDIKSISINALPDRIVVYPNPIGQHQFLNIRSELAEDLLVTIFDITGKKLKQASISGGNGQISLEGLANGFYYYQIAGKGFLKNGALVVE